MYFREILRVTKPEMAEKLIEAINGKTYMNFRVGVCPAMGEFSVVVESDYDAPDSEIDEMLFSVLAHGVVA
jgi:hypothetical protein